MGGRKMERHTFKNRPLVLIKLWEEYVFIDPWDIFIEHFYDSEFKLYGLRLIDLKLLDIYEYEQKEKHSYIVGFFETEDEASLFSEMLYDELLSLYFHKKSVLPYLDIQELRNRLEKIKKMEKEGVFVIRERDIELIDYEEEEW